MSFKNGKLASTQKTRTLESREAFSVDNSRGKLDGNASVAAQNAIRLRAGIPWETVIERTAYLRRFFSANYEVMKRHQGGDYILLRFAGRAMGVRAAATMGET